MDEVLPVKEGDVLTIKPDGVGVKGNYYVKIKNFIVFITHTPPEVTVDSLMTVEITIIKHNTMNDKRSFAFAKYIK